MVLVHGAFADASSWEWLIERLEARGATVFAPANPLRGLYSDSAYILSVLNRVKGPIVLAGYCHGRRGDQLGSGGQPEMRGQVAGVRLGADALHVGESGMSLSERFPSALATATSLCRSPRAVASAGPMPHVKRDKVHPVFAACLCRGEPGEPAGGHPAARDHHRVLGESQGRGLEGTIRSWALVGRQDMTINPEQERFQAKSMRTPWSSRTPATCR